VIGEQVVESDSSMAAWLVEGDLAGLEQADECGPGNSEQGGSLTGAHDRVTWRNGDGKTARQRDHHVVEYLEQLVRQFDAATVTSDERRASCCLERSEQFGQAVFSASGKDRAFRGRGGHRSRVAMKRTKRTRLSWRIGCLSTAIPGLDLMPWRGADGM
jgi:hypothetical protein